MANVLKIKKNSTWDSTSNPSNSDVVYGELAWANGTKRLYIGRQSTSGGAVTATRIGGEVGLANDNIVKLDEACSSGEVAVYGSTGLTGRTTAEFKSDLSINNVENTALSTWAGSTNITTLGTIGTGTWNGTAIAVTKGGTGATDAGTARTNLGLGTSDNVQFANATVSNLIVNGTTTTVNTNDLVVADSLIFLAKDQSGTPTLDSGFVVERGSSDNVGLIWDESADEFSFVTTDETGGTDGNVTISDQANVRASTFYGALSGNASTATNVAYTGLTGTVPTWNQNTTGTAANVTGTVAIANGGTGATSASAARTSLGITLANLGYTGVSNANNFTMNVSNDGGSSAAFASGDTLNITGGSGIGVNRTNSSYSIAVDTTSVCTLTATQVLDNKTIDGGTF
tara:strand:- start:1914 stop:3113 length:1200 start_codon:yes stop_codon:yes gene_type:complete